MDWLSIVIAVLVFVVPALLERDKKKKQRERWKKTDLPDREDAQESLETRDVQREFAPVDGRDLTEDPYRMENVEPAVPSVLDASSGSYVTDSHSFIPKPALVGGRLCDRLLQLCRKGLPGLPFQCPLLPDPLLPGLTDLRLPSLKSAGSAA